MKNIKIIINNLLCYIGLHSWTFISKEVPISKKDISYGIKTNVIGQENTYKYECKNCEHYRIKIKGYTYLGDYEKWQKKLN